MLSVESFISLVDNKFWKHIHRGTDFPNKGRVPDRKKFLSSLFHEVKAAKYAPSPPRGYVVSHKENLVVRFIPALTREDYCVYFYCLRALEDELAKNRVEGTYGGWKLGGKIRKLENSEEEAMDVPYGSDHGYNKHAWKEAWTEFQRKAYELHSNNRYQYYVVFDVANFYDCIRLDRLENLVRSVVGSEKSQEVSLLFYFLSHWNRKYLSYERQSVGLPQDEVGDCSRILSNFYLQDYDSYMSKLTREVKARYLRYADDQILACRTDKDAKKLMFHASEGLAKIGLNLNASKARFFDRVQYEQYWSFDIFELLSAIDDNRNIVKAYRLFKARKAKLAKTGEKMKTAPVLKRFLNCQLGKLPGITRGGIIKLVLDDDFIKNANSYYLGKTYSLLDRQGKRKFIDKLEGLSESVLFNQYHLRVIRFARESRISLWKFRRVRENLRQMNRWDRSRLESVR